MGRSAGVAIAQISPFLRIKREQAELALELQDGLTFSRYDDPFPWFGPGYNFKQMCIAMRERMIDLNQSRNRLRGKHAAGRLLDGREWNEVPQPEPA